jgi:RimJ/RimL family protein N-acetyltransferase
MISLDPPIQTERLTLRAFTPADVDGVLDCYRRPDIVRYLYGGVLDRDGVLKLLEKRAGQQRIAVPGDAVVAAVQERATGRYVGEVDLHWISEQHGQAEIGFLIHPDQHRKGYAREGTSALIDLAISALRVHRIIGRADARNTASMAAMRSLGMRQEAHLIENEWVKGEWTDEVIFAVLAAEWQSRIRPLNAR